MTVDAELIDLSSAWGQLRVSGVDADSFLQGQLGNDLRKLDDRQAQLSSYSSPKGRMLAVMTLRRDGEHIDIEMPRELLDPIAKRLRMFVLRSKVQIADAPAAILGLRGTASPAWLQARGLPVPAAPLDVLVHDGLRVMRRHGTARRYSLHGTADQLSALLAASGGHPPADAAAWNLDDVLAGVPVVLAATQDHFVAQMANLDRLGGISFDKGCYTGQEIVARLHYLGQLKRRLFLCRGAGAPPLPGTPVHETGQDQAVGEVLNAAADGEHFAASIVLQLSQAGSEQLRVGETALSQPQAYEYTL